MDVPEEHMSMEEMIEKIAELEYSQNQLRNLNSEMRQWLDVADDDMAALRSQNAALKKQLKVLETTVSATQQTEEQPGGSSLTNELDVNKCNGKTQKLEDEESTTMKEQNKRLTAELKSLQQEREQDKINSSRLNVALHTLQKEIEEAQLVLQDRDEVIHQKNLKLKHLEEILEESSNFIQELRLTNQELRKQLEDKQNEASFFAMNNRMGEKEGLPCPPLSVADEISLLTSSAEGETDGEELLQPQSLAVDLRPKRCAGILDTAICRVGLFILSIFVFALLAFVASESCARNYDLFSISTLWRGARLMLQPYISVHYGALPPV